MKNPFRPYGLRRAYLAPAVLALPLLGPSFANAREYDPFMMYVFPAGGQRGTTVEGIMARGRGLEGTKEIRISGKGVTAKVLAIEEPSTRLRQRSANRQDQAENPNVVKFSVTIAPDAELGQRDLWLITPKGPTNRRHFVVGQIPEVNEADDDSIKGEPQSLDALPILVNGQYNQGDHDIFRFTAKAGQTLVCEAQGRTLIPYIPDAVPGWFQPCLTLYDATGKELKFADDFRFHPDPVLIYDVQRDGEYLIEVRDALFRGREDLIYRLAIGALPYITHIYPLGGRRKSDAQVELHGVNLATTSVNFALPGDAPPLRLIQVTANGLTSNALPFAVDARPEVAEAEPNDSIEQANKIEAPLTVNGRIQQSGDDDHFAFSAKKGQRLVMDVRARRLDSPIDPVLTLLNARGGVLAENDDTEDLSAGLVTHHADSYLSYTFRADGDYILKLRDVQAKGGEEYSYRLTITPPRSDFDLRIVPANLSLGQGAAALAKVKAYRRDGFNAAIRIAMEGLPPGFAVSPAMIPAGQNETRLTVVAPPDAPMGIVSPTVTGTAVLDGDASTERKAAEEALAKVQGRLETADAEYGPAEKAAQEAEGAAARAKDAAAKAAAAQNGAESAAAAKRQQADALKKKMDALIEGQQKPLEAKLAGATRAVIEATAAKAAVDTALAEAKALTASRRQAHEAAEKAAQEAEAEAKEVSEDAGKSAEEKKRSADQAAAGRKLADEARSALTRAQQNEQQAQSRADAAARRLSEGEAQKKSADDAWASVKIPSVAATEAFQAADKEAREAEAAAVEAKARADQATAAQAPSERAAAEKRRLANEAKAKRDKLANDGRAARARLAQAEKKLQAATVRRQAVPAEELMQAFYYWHDVPTEELLLAVIKPTTFTLSTNISATDVQEIRQKSNLSVTVKVSREGLKAALARVQAEKKAADGALAKVKADLEKAKADHGAAEKAARQAAAAAAKAKPDEKAQLAQVAAEKRRLANEAKARRDRLTADVKAATAKVTEVGKKVSEANARAKAAINLKADGPPRGITVKPVNVTADKDEATITVTVTNQAPVGVQQNVLITGTLKAGRDSVVQPAPAIPVRVLAAAK